MTLSPFALYVAIPVIALIAWSWAGLLTFFCLCPKVPIHWRMAFVLGAGPLAWLAYRMVGPDDEKRHVCHDSACNRE